MSVLTSFSNGGSLKDFRDTFNAMLADIAALKAGTVKPTPTPAPVFTVQPSIVGTPQVGQTLTGMDGTITGGTVVSRRWLLGTAVVSTAQMYAATAAGSLVYEVTTIGPGGTTVATSAAVTVVPALAAKLGQIGFNVGDDCGQVNSSFTFLDRMKSSGYNGWWSGPGTAPVDVYGYLTGLDGAAYRDTFVGLRRPTSGTLRHVLRHNGTGWQFELTLVDGVTIVDASDPNRVIFDVAAKAGEVVAKVTLRVTGATSWPTYKPGNPIATRDGIAVYELAHEDLYLAGEIVHPAWAAAHVDTFRLRFMDAMKINHSAVQGVADRTPMGSMSYNANSVWGMPLEAAVALCNRVGANLHLCVPHKAGVAWQEWAFGYVRDNLLPALTCDLEYSNEVWNGQFGQNAYATAAGSGDSNRGFGLLAVPVINRARAVFGAQAARVRGIFARQGGIPYTFTLARDGVEAVEGKKLRDYFAEVSFGFYLDGGAQDLVIPSGSADDRKAMMDVVAAYEAAGTVPQALVDQMRTGNGGLAGWPQKGSLAHFEANLQMAADFARAEGIPHLSGYEGQNWHINANGPLGQTDARRVMAMMTALANDPRVSGTQAGSLMRDQYAQMRSYGMVAQTVYMDFFEPGSEYGCWGSKPSAVHPDTGLWSFYRWYQQQHPDVPLFELRMTGGNATVVAGQPFTRTIASFGGLIPASAVSIAALPSGIAFVGSRLSGTVAAGDYPVSFSAGDGGGTVKTLDVPLKAVTVPTYRYLKLIIAQTADTGNRQGGPRLVDLFVIDRSGTEVDAVTWSGPTSEYSSGDTVDHLNDRPRNTNVWTGPIIGNHGPAELTAVIDAATSIGALGIYPLGAGDAPAVWKLYASSSPIPADNAGAALLIDKSEAGNKWANGVRRDFTVS